jgi:hypothetical protein
MILTSGQICRLSAFRRGLDPLEASLARDLQGCELATCGVRNEQ